MNFNNYVAYTSFIVTLFLTFLIYQVNFLYPSEYVFNFSGDAIKNYFTYVQYIESNTNYSNFEYFHYPYGESIFYTDCQPILAVSLKTLQDYFGFQTNNIGLLNLLLLLNIPLTALFTSLLLKYKGVSWHLNLVYSVGLAFLSPQIERLTGHFGLAYSFYFPLCIYLIFRLFDSPIQSKKWAWALSFTIIAAFLTHAYLGMMLAMLVILSACLFASIGGNRIVLLWAIIAGILPVIIFKTGVEMLDSHEFRTTNPWGFFKFHSNFWSVFFPNRGILKDLLQHIFSLKNQSWAGHAYIGLLAIGSILIGALQLLKSRSLSVTKSETALLVSSTIVLMYSFCLPFKLGLEDMADAFPIIKNFRALGRFAWVFFWVINIVGVTYIHRRFQASRYFHLFTIPVAILIFIETKDLHQHMSSELTKTKNPFNIENLSQAWQHALDIIDSSNHQAIIPLPFWHKGSENWGIEGSAESHKIVQLLCYHSNIPTFSSYLTRVSMAETQNIFSFISPLERNKIIQNLLDDEKSILLAVTDSFVSPIEQVLVDNSNFLCSTQEFSLYDISLSDITNLHIDETYPFDQDSIIYQDSFDSLESEYVFKGNGAQQINEQSKQLVELNPNLFTPNHPYSLSLWGYGSPGDRYGQNMQNYFVFINIERHKGEKITKSHAMNHTINVKNKWLRVDIPFIVPEDASSVKISVWGDAKPKYIDELRIFSMN